jgi:hypothetical protein
MTGRARQSSNQCQLHVTYTYNFSCVLHAVSPLPVIVTHIYAEGIWPRDPTGVRHQELCWRAPAEIYCYADVTEKLKLNGGQVTRLSV